MLIAKGQRDRWQATGHVRLNFILFEMKHAPLSHQQLPHIIKLDDDSVLPPLLRHVRWLMAEGNDTPMQP